MDVAPIFKEDFTEQFGKLIDWFRVSGTIKSQHVSLAYDKIKYYPLEALTDAVDYFLENSRPTPGGFPTLNEIMARIWIWLENHPHEKFKRMTFDPDDDLRYPVSKMWDGYHVLCRDGLEAFYRFADINRMPKTDRERVVMKWKVSRANKKMPDLTKGIGKTV